MKILQRVRSNSGRVGFQVFGAMAILGLAPSIGHSQSTNPIPEPITKGSIRIELDEIGSNLTAPHYLTHANDNSGRLFAADQAGDITLLKNEVVQPTPYFSVSSLLTPLGLFNPPGSTPGPFNSYDERGLLGLAFHPEFAVTGQPGYGKFYTYTSEDVAGAADFTVPLPPGTSANHQSVVREWTVDPSLDDVTGSATGREVMRVDQPQFNHNGGGLVFGPDRHLYIGIGDGGGANDVGDGHGPNGNGANLETVHGSIVRINPLGSNSSNGRYGNPADNPYVGVAGLDEIYASGLRNPFAFGFDVNAASGFATAIAPRNNDRP